MSLLLTMIKLQGNTCMTKGRDENKTQAELLSVFLLKIYLNGYNRPKTPDKLEYYTSNTLVGISCTFSSFVSSLYRFCNHIQLRRSNCSQYFSSYFSTCPVMTSSHISFQLSVKATGFVCCQSIAFKQEITEVE